MCFDDQTNSSYDNLLKSESKEVLFSYRRLQDFPSLHQEIPYR